MPNYTTQQVANLLGISTRAVRFAAEALSVGEKFGDRLLFTDDDIERLRNRKTKRGPAAGSRRKEHKEQADE